MSISLFFQVLEVFSSEGDLHLELPTGEKEAPRSLWVCCCLLALSWEKKMNFGSNIFFGWHNWTICSHSKIALFFDFTLFLCFCCYAYKVDFFPLTWRNIYFKTSREWIKGETYREKNTTHYTSLVIQPDMFHTPSVLFNQLFCAPVVWFCLQEIPPYETRTIMKAKFIGRTENNHTAFIRIRTDYKQMLVLPMEVEVTSSELRPTLNLCSFIWCMEYFLVLCYKSALAFPSITAYLYDKCIPLGFFFLVKHFRLELLVGFHEKAMRQFTSCSIVNSGKIIYGQLCENKVSALKFSWTLM